jgi:hypothetical protein
VKDKKLGSVSGVETLKTLAGAVGMASFTVGSLAERTGVSKETVDTVLRRYGEAFERLGPISRRGRGRPEVRWQLRPDAIDEVVAEVEKLQLAIGAERLTSADALEPDLVEASLTTAARSVLRAPVDDPGTASAFVAAARASLLAAGFDGAVSDMRGEQAPKADLQGQRARLINAVADVVEAEVTGDTGHIDDAQARALALVEETKSNMPAEDWLPLANRVVEAAGTVLAAPVAVVDADDQTLLEKLFPWLVLVPSANLPPSTDEDASILFTHILADRRLRPASPGTSMPFVIPQIHVCPLLETGTAAAISASLRKQIHHRASIYQPLIKQVVVTQYVNTAIMGTIYDSDARLVLIRSEPRETQTNFARVVNRLAVGLDA